jgi:hypothetical protein
VRSLREAQTKFRLRKTLDPRKEFRHLPTVDSAASTKALEGSVSRRAEQERLALAREELDAMSRAMVEEKGLLNFQQGATLLGVTRQRVYEMSMTGILRRFTYCGAHYVSYREVLERRQADIKGGRPKRGLVERLAVSLKAATQTDRAQAKLGGYAGPVYRPKKKK